MNITCDKCDKNFDAQANYVELPHKELFLNCGFKCPHCQTFFHSHYDHPKLKARRLKFAKAKSVLERQKIQRQYEKYSLKMQEVAASL